MAAYPLRPELECDVVMKGGITSGVIYPQAVCELARTYRLRAVGGASAGAIAAAAAAAAEVGRAAGGFEKLERLPTDITAPSRAGGSTLFRLFQPTRQTAPLFRALTAGMGHAGAAGALRTLGALVRGFWPWVVLGALLGVAVAVVSATGSGPARWAGVVGGLVLALLGAAAGIGVGAVRVLGGPVPAAGFGMCTGMAGAGADGAPALTPWLHDRIQDMAGRTTADPPLTFADLAAGGVELRTMTTNLTRHQPMAMPWTDREYFFDPAQMRALFPEDVVTWMESHPPPPTGDAEADWLATVRRVHAGPLRPLPHGPDLPVLVATRMSLSFPVLITAVPLHAVDLNRVANRAADEAARAWFHDHTSREGAATGVPSARDAAGALPAVTFEPNWFSDGGICSNLPVHFFDATIPTRPTFAVDLAHFPVDLPKSAEEAENSYLPRTETGGLLRRWYRRPTTGMAGLGGFLLSVVETARGWVDAGQLVMPGYRDRVVTIWHDDAEGGMNLTMPPETVTALAARGRGAAAKLVEQFAGTSTEGSPAVTGWEKHRWIRFRTATCGLHGLLASLRTGYSTVSPGAPPYSALAGPDATAALPCHPLSPTAREVVNRRTAALVALAEEWGTEPADAFVDGAPLPRPRIRLVPDDGTAAGLTAQAPSLES